MCDVLCSPNTSTSAPADPSNVERDTEAEDNLAVSKVLSTADRGQLRKWLRQDKRPMAGKLLYRASRDGWAVQRFHELCDGKGPTVVVAKSTGGHIFGGYTEKSWTSPGGHQECRESFLFRLSGPGVAQPSLHRIFQYHQYGIHYNVGYGPAFGGGHDVHFQPSGAAMQVIFNIGHTYNQTGEAGSGSFSYLAEAQTVNLTDYEVYELVPATRLSSVKEDVQDLVKELKGFLDVARSHAMEKALDSIHAALDCELAVSKRRQALHEDCAAAKSEGDFVKQFLGRRGCDSSSIIRLNVSGKVMETFRSTLLWHECSTLAAKFKEEHWTIQGDEMIDGGIFFEQDPDLFELLLLHLRLGSLTGQSFTPKVPDAKRGAWKRFTQYFNLAEQLLPSFDSVVMTDEVAQRLLTWLPDKTWTLLYRASRDGWAVQRFHELCDNKGPTVVVAKSGGGHIFGGYTEKSWTSPGGYQECRESFLFRLSGPGVAQPSLHRIFQYHQAGIHYNVGYGPTFGGGHDVHFQPSGAAMQVIFNIGHTYNQTGEAGSGSFSYLAEAQTVNLTDYEVFGCGV